MKTFRLRERTAGVGAGEGRSHRATGLSRRGLGLLLAVLLLAVLLVLPGCAYYSFTGASIPQRLNTVAVPLAENSAVSRINNLDQQLTDLLTSRLVGQTRLNLEPNENRADAVLTTRITGYEVRPVDPSAEQNVATRNRVTIAVEVRYYDQVEDQEMLSRTFENFGEYNPNETGLDGERTAAQEALEKIADDIFSAATSDW